KKSKSSKKESSSKKDSPAKGRGKVAKKEETPGKEEEEGEPEYKWWLDTEKDDSVKWTTLQHNGPIFPPPYEPHGVKMLYDGVEVTLEPEAEEVATFFAQVIGTDWGENKTFQKNFFTDFLLVLERSKPSVRIEKFEKCDFTPITAYLLAEKERKKAASKEEKQALKEEKAAIDEKYGWALLDGRKEKVGNYRIEPPGLFRGRGEHPKTGSLKLRVEPEQVTINIGDSAEVPVPPAGHKWGNISHDNTVTWLAMWKENVNDSIKYVFLAANSSLKGQSDLKKKPTPPRRNPCLPQKHMHKIREDYTAALKDQLMERRQQATAIYLIDRLALRAGNEKGDDEADTVGCCSLRYEHISLEPPNKVIFDFLGKDSMRYYNEVEVIDQVFKNLKIFKKGKSEGDDLFDRLTTGTLNKHLHQYMPGLTAKELAKTPVNGTVAEKMLAYQRANRQVAVLCNHQRTVSKGHSAQIGKIQEKIMGLKYERHMAKKDLVELDPKVKKTQPKLVEPESDVDDDFIERHERFLVEQEEAKLAVKLEKENEKRKEEGLEPLKSLPKAPIRAKPVMAADKLEKKIESLTEKIKTQRVLLIDKDENKATALSTSKINYIDPRISAAWAYKFNVPVDKVFNKSLREKFKWALDVDADW
ncbi:hypothetical protein BDK51DRAFT_12332, partial [Blyttiomyces helicus]